MSQQIEVNIPDLFRKGFVLWILVGLLVVVGFITSMYTVQAESQGVVLRFGKYLKTVEPGLRFKLPFGVDNVYVLPVRRQLKQEYGFGTPGGNNNSQFAESRTRSREKA
jgi:membrane protease subunit HflK